MATGIPVQHGSKSGMLLIAKAASLSSPPPLTSWKVEAAIFRDGRRRFAAASLLICFHFEGNYVGHTIAIDCFTSRRVLNVTVNLYEEVEISLNESRI